MREALGKVRRSYSSGALDRARDRHRSPAGDPWNPIAPGYRGGAERYWTQLRGRVLRPPPMLREAGSEHPPLTAACLVACVGMSAEPVHEVDPDDPVEILRVLPARFHDQFLREYYAAAALAARQVGGYRQLHDVLRLWRLTAMAQSDSGFATRLAAVQEAVRSGSLEGSVPIEEIVPGWPGPR